MAALACNHPDCSAPAVRRCYFCPHSYCLDHITVTPAGAICQACSEAERQKQEQTRQAAAAQAKGSGCLLLLAVTSLCLIFAAARRRASGPARGR